ncbi:hypothetical protein [Sneathiella limimaris]|uniref:hypothetical protein n=1 Tax=Sneathiella limimaris TaxID=1964213 RepID=UPI00146F6AEC|nr:hypothetical protein [Sneathiella limimaris]
MKKGVLIAISLILLVFIGGVAFIYASIGSVISETLAKQGSDITQTSVTVGEADFSTTSGLAAIDGLQVANPAGFNSELAFNFDRTELWIDLETLNSKALHIKSLVVPSFEVFYEIADNTDNLRTLKKQIERSITTGVGADSKKLIIESLQLKNGVLVVVSDSLQGAKKTATLETISLSGVGVDQGGVTTAQLAELLTIQILRASTIAALETDLPLDEQARNIMNGALDETQNAIKLFKDLIK